MRATPWVDVAIVGGGPAGAATAIALARTGLAVALLERTRYETTRVGEALPPEVRLPLSELGVWDQFVVDGHAPSPGLLSAWGTSRLYENDFIVNPYGDGWQIDRRRFEEMLVVAAQQAGAEVHRAARVSTCVRQASGIWQLTASRESETVHLCAGFLVAATGRASWVPHSTSARRVALDRLVGLVAFLTSPVSTSGGDHRTLVEAAENGWWYSALLPNRRLVVAYMTDAEQIAGRRRCLGDFWQAVLQESPYTRERVESCTGRLDLRIVAADSSRREQVVGPGWLSVGDAAAAFDPLSSQGVYKALESGLRGAHAIIEHRRGRKDALREHAAQVQAGFEQYLRARAWYYGRERRWPHSLFWQRRQAPSGPSFDLREEIQTPA
jgi:2-polyprenyl-6-methoxyphenol hydroxylase-like FAD-dependent oxidoreductase